MLLLGKHWVGRSEAGECEEIWVLGSFEDRVSESGCAVGVVELVEVLERMITRGLDCNHYVFSHYE